MKTLATVVLAVGLVVGGCAASANPVPAAPVIETKARLLKALIDRLEAEEKEAIRRESAELLRQLRVALGVHVEG